MKYTAYAVMIMGIMIACFAIVQYVIISSPDSPIVTPTATDEKVPTPFVAPLLIFAAMLIILGMVLAVYGGIGYEIVRLKIGRRSAQPLQEPQPESRN